jgi:hypothetical protein
LDVKGTINATAGNFAGFVTAGTLRIGTDINGTNDGLYFTSNTDFIYDTGNFRLGNGNVTWDGTALNVNGVINATSGNFDGFMTVAGGSMKFGKDVSSTNDGLHIDANNYWYDSGNFKVGGASKYMSWNGSTLTIVGDITATTGAIGGWTIDSNSIFSGTKGTNGAYTAAAGSVTISSEGWISSKNFRISSTGAVNADVIDVSDVLATSAYFGSARGSYTIAIDTNAMTLAGYSKFDLGPVAGIAGTATSYIAFTDGAGSPSATVLSSFGSTGLTVNGAITATGNITAYYSDERLKTKLGNITNAIDKLSQLNGFYYTNNKLANSFGYTDDKTQLGLSAQEVQCVFPNIVSLAPFDRKVSLPNEETNYDTIPESKSGENYLTIDYSKLVPVLVEAIKELKAEIEELKKNK